MNTQPTVETMMQAAQHLQWAADELTRKAIELQETEDFTLTGEALNIISNLFGNLRLDLFAIRPLREHVRRIVDLEG